MPPAAEVRRHGRRGLDGTAAGAPQCSVQLGPELAADGLGGVYALPQLEVPFDFGCGPASGSVLMRLDASGACLWSKGYPWSAEVSASLTAPPSASVRLLPADGGALYVADTAPGAPELLGCAPSTLPGPSSFVAKLDGCGDCAWSRDVATAALDVQLSPAGGVVLATSFSGTIDLGGGPLASAGTDLAVGALSASGAPLWSARFGAAGAAVTLGAASVDGTGGVALRVSVTGAAVDFGGGPVSGSVLVKLDASGAFRFQVAPFDAGFFASDPCGAVITATYCASCAPGGDWGALVTKLSP